MSFTNVAANFHTFNNWNVGGRDFHLCKSVLTVRHATTASNSLETARCCSSPYLGRHVRREEAELYMDGSMCHRGCSGHQSCHCWLNESGKMIALQVHNDPKNDGELIFFFLHVLLLNGCLGVCVYVWKRGRWHICNENRLRITPTWRKHQVRKR